VNLLAAALRARQSHPGPTWRCAATPSLLQAMAWTGGVSRAGARIPHLPARRHRRFL